MRHPSWRHTVLFGDSACLCDSNGVCRAHSGGPPTPQLQPGYRPTSWDDLVATRDPGDYTGRHRVRTRALLLTVALLLAGCASEPEGSPTSGEYDRYQQLCHDKGGVVGVVAVHWATVEYNCIGESFDELLPRFNDA